MAIWGQGEGRGGEGRGREERRGEKGKRGGGRKGREEGGGREGERGDTVLELCYTVERLLKYSVSVTGARTFHPQTDGNLTNDPLDVSDML